MNVFHIKGIIVITVLWTQWQDINFFQAPIMKILQNLEASKMASYICLEWSYESRRLCNIKRGKNQECIEFSKSYRFVNKI